MIAALYVHPRGPYVGRPDVDPWMEDRDARRYRGPHPVVAHPPCARWGRYWSGGPSARERRKLGDDGGCFLRALIAVCRWGGVLEHPEASHAWPEYGLVKPPRRGGWVPAGHLGGWTCCVEQGHYGHRARKATWLFAHGMPREALPELAWGPSEATLRMDLDFHSAEERRRAIRTGATQRMSKVERALTPPAFAGVLIGIARLAR